MSLIWGFCGVFLGVMTSLTAKELDALVSVYSTKTNGEISSGAGFFISPQGHLVTCYHVVQGGRLLEVTDQWGKRYQVSVVGVAPSHDLAVLKIDVKNYAPPGHLHLAKEVPRRGLTYTIFGHPFGILNLSLEAKGTHDGYRESITVNDENGQQIFATKLDLFLLDGTVGTGMSGGPVIVNGRVVGILSGSLEQRGMLRSIVWAIPCKYIPYDSAQNTITLQGIWKQSGQSWPALTMMAKVWNFGLKRFLPKDPGENIKAFASAIKDIDENHEALRQICLRGKRSSTKTLVLFQKVEVAVANQGEFGTSISDLLVEFEKIREISVEFIKAIQERNIQKESLTRFTHLAVADCKKRSQSLREKQRSIIQKRLQEFVRLVPEERSDFGELCTQVIVTITDIEAARSRIVQKMENGNPSSEKILNDLRVIKKKNEILRECFGKISAIREPFRAHYAVSSILQLFTLKDVTKNDQ